MGRRIADKLRGCLSGRCRETIIVVLILLASLGLRWFLFHFQGSKGDLWCFSYWYSGAAERGLHDFYGSVWCDYPPFNVYIFWVFGKLSQALGPDSLPTIIKVPQNLFDLATAYLVFCFVRQRFSFRAALAIMAVYAFNPATIYDLAVWGQVDSIYTFFMVASLYSAFKKQYEISGGLFSLAILTKPQSIVLLPVLAYIILREGRWRRAVTSALVFTAVVFLVIIPFDWQNPITFLIDRYLGYARYPYNSLNAYNVWALLGGFLKSDTTSYLGLSLQVWGILLFVAFLALVMWLLHRRYEGKSAVFAVFLLTFGFFMLMTRMHERYLFAAFALLAMAWATRLTPLIYLGLTATYLANLVYVLVTGNAEASISDGHWSIYVLAPINIVLLGLAIWDFWRVQRRPKEEATVRKPAADTQQGPQ